MPAKTPAALPGSPDRRAVWLAAATLLLTVFAAYANGLSGPFVFDDPPAIPENTTIRRLWPPGEVFSPPAGAGVGGRPLANFTYALNYALGGNDVTGFHVGNVLLHALAALALFGLVRRTLLNPLLRERFGAAATWLALGVAGLWALHPLQTTAVNYLSQRTEVLMGLCYLLTLYCFARSVEPDTSRLWGPAAVLACAAGMAAKEVMVTAPVLALLYDRTFGAGSFAGAWRARWKTYLAFAATWGLLAWLLIGVGQRGVGFGQGLTGWQYAAIGCYALVTYFRLAFWPHPLVFDYGPNVADDLWLAPYIAVVLLTAALIGVALWRAPRLGFLGAWLLLIPAPTSSVVPIARQFVAENRAYLPLAAVAAAVVLALHGRLGRRSLWVCAALALAAGAFTARRNLDYRTAVSLWTDTVEKRPANWRAHNLLALALKEAGRLDEASTQLEASLKIRPDFAEPHHNLGAVLMQQGRLEEAVASFERSLAIEPWRLDTQIARANLLWNLGRAAEAIAQFESILARTPGQPEAEAGWGNALLQLGRTEEAIPHYEAALRRMPQHADANNNLGLALVRLGRFAEALPHHAAAVRLSPRSALMHENYAVALLQAQRPTEAVAEFETALALNERSADGHHNLAVALMQLGREAEARRHLEIETRLRP